MWIVREYHCDQCGERIESLELRGAGALVHCGVLALPVVSAPKVRTVYANVARGKNERPPPLSTAAIADGMPTGEWRQKRAALRGRR